MKHLEMFSLLSQGQHGFRQKKSCKTAVIQLFNLLFPARRKKLFTCCNNSLFESFWYTQSTLHHQSVTSLSYWRCVFKLVYILSDWLLARTKYSETFSDALPVTYGMLQGSILGPIIFKIFLNHLLKIKSGKFCCVSRWYYSHSARYISRIDVSVYAGAARHCACLVWCALSLYQHRKVLLYDCFTLCKKAFYMHSEISDRVIYVINCWQNKNTWYPFF